MIFRFTFVSGEDSAGLSLPIGAYRTVARFSLMVKAGQLLPLFTFLVLVIDPGRKQQIEDENENEDEGGNSG